MTFTLGFKALAYPASSSPSLLPCSLAFRCDAAAEQATVLLVATVQTTQGAQTFALQCDADKLRAASLSRGNSQLLQPQLDGLLRHQDNKQPDVKTLALEFERPCPLWCARSEADAFVPKAGSEQAFQQLVSLAKATSIHVVFDYKFVARPYQTMFRAFSKAAPGLRGFPVDHLLAARDLRRASWDVFGPSDATGVPPPAYDNARKRPRQSSSGTGSPHQSPKRLAPQSPSESHTSDQTVPLSPAAAAAIEKALRASPAFDYQSTAINAAVAQQLPAALKDALPTLLRDIMPTLFAGSPSQSNHSTPRTSFRSSSVEPSPPSPVDPSRTSFDQTTPSQEKLPKLSPLARTLLPHLALHLNRQFRTHERRLLKRFTTLLEAETSLIAHESADLLDELEEAKAELSLLREDAISELVKETSTVLERGREEGVELADGVGERLLTVWGEACEHVDRVGKWEVKKMVRREVARWNRAKARRGIRKGVGVGGETKRAGARLLGRRRETQGEWEDVDVFYDSDDLDLDM